MKTTTSHGYAIFTFPSIILTSLLLYSQRDIVYDADTSVDVIISADVWADSKMLRSPIRLKKLKCARGVTMPAIYYVEEAAIM
jgi:hypothetical protein